jgi:hypothetical protein
MEGMMKQGIILYVMGGGDLPEGLTAGTFYQGLRRSDGPMEIVVSQPGILELNDAWHFLVNLGYDTIHLLVTMAEADRLRPLYPLVRLTGVAREMEDPSGECLTGRVLQ